MKIFTSLPLEFGYFSFSRSRKNYYLSDFHLNCKHYQKDSRVEVKCDATQKETVTPQRGLLFSDNRQCTEYSTYGWMKQQLVFPRKSYCVNKDAVLVDSKSSCFQPCQRASEIQGNCISTAKDTLALKRKRGAIAHCRKDALSFFSSLFYSKKFSFATERKHQPFIR